MITKSFPKKGFGGKKKRLEKSEDKRFLVPIFGYFQRRRKRFGTHKVTESFL